MFLQKLRSTSKCLLFCFAGISVASAQETGHVDFGKQVRPILSDTCFKCHGPDEHDRQAGLRLDTKEAVFDEFAVVIPGDADASDLYQRIIAEDEDLLMPPPDSGRKLSTEQKDLIRRWIQQGAEWQQHWSFVAPESVSPPTDPTGWSRSPIDEFIAAKLKTAGLSPSTEADRHDLIRRVALDLTGLPPSDDQISRFGNATDSDWYERLVDELLDSPQYGEHMARFWLDAARYGDTHGLHLDNYREMWLYRDWVIEAFNRNLPFDRFTIEQLAGDMLEDSTEQQKIASGFNRAHVTTSEGGSITEEVYVRNVVDRVSTTGTVFLGLTVECAQCHDHKFDPISQKEFYQLFAFFNNMTDPPLDKNIKDPQPVLRFANPAQAAQIEKLKDDLGRVEEELKKQMAAYTYHEPVAVEQKRNTSETSEIDTEPVEFVWLDDDLPAGAKPQSKWDFIGKGAGPVHDGETSRVQISDGLVQHYFTDAVPLRVQAGDRFFAYAFLDPENPPVEIMLQFNDGNWDHRVFWGENRIDWGTTGKPSRQFAGALPETGKWVRLEVPVEQVGFKNLSLVNGLAFTQFGGKVHWDSAGVVTRLDQTNEFRSFARWRNFARTSKGQGLPADIRKLIQQDEALSGQQQKTLLDYFLVNVHPEARAHFSALVRDKSELKKQLTDVQNKLPTTLISKERDDIKPAFLLNRGEYDNRGEQVQRATPAMLPPMPEDAPLNRLGFAQWLVSKDHPLTARVAVNRFWQQLFGTGIVKTAEDFGAQGDQPSHPQLLDWLAVDFVEHGWNVKYLMKSMVTSATYRQSSKSTPELVAKDPENRLLARGPRFRLDAESLRDQALDISGLLVQKIGGPSVKPPQPDGLWFVVGYSGSNTVRFKKDEGPDKVHRRSLYTFWKRTAPPPQMNTFDAPSRESCSVRRERTNTPLQALLLMNDPQYVEAARHLAQRTLDAADAPNSRLQFLFLTALKRPPRPEEVDLLMDTLQQDQAEFFANVDNAKKLIAIGEIPPPEGFEPVELASWTMLASLIMNSDEFVCKN